MSQCSGVLEWCEGTLPIGMYLIGEKDETLGAHKRFRPQDITARACRDKMVVSTSLQRLLSKWEFTITTVHCIIFELVTE